MKYFVRCSYVIIFALFAFETYSVIRDYFTQLPSTTTDYVRDVNQVFTVFVLLAGKTALRQIVKISRKKNHLCGKSDKCFNNEYYEQLP